VLAQQPSQGGGVGGRRVEDEPLRVRAVGVDPPQLHPVHAQARERRGRQATRRAAREPGDDAARAYSVLLRKIVGFSGLVHENMYRFMGWRFLSLGRAIERGLDTLYLVRACVDDAAPHGTFDLAIEVGDSVMTHRRRYTIETDRRTVIELLLLDDMNPRSVHLQLEALREHAEFLPHLDDDRITPFQVRVVELVTRLASVRAEDVTNRKLDRLIRDAGQLHMLLDANYLH
jgi:uncharacterized alpha-E superfamily protein